MKLNEITGNLNTTITPELMQELLTKSGWNVTLIKIMDITDVGDWIQVTGLIQNNDGRQHAVCFAVDADGHVTECDQ